MEAANLSGQLHVSTVVLRAPPDSSDHQPLTAMMRNGGKSIAGHGEKIYTGTRNPKAMMVDDVSTCAVVEPVGIVRGELLQRAGLDKIGPLRHLDLTSTLQVLAVRHNEFVSGDVLDANTTAGHLQTDAIEMSRSLTDGLSLKTRPTQCVPFRMCRIQYSSRGYD